MNVKDNIETRVREILGASLINNGFELNDELTSLAHAVCYINTQFGFIKQFIPEQEEKDYVEKVRSGVLEIISKK